MAKAGDKYIIEIEEVYHGNPDMKPFELFRIKGFNSLVFDSAGLEKLEKFECADALPSHGFKLGDEIIDEEKDLGVVIMSKETGIMYMDYSTCTWFISAEKLPRITKTGKRYPEIAYILEALRNGRPKFK